MLTLIGIDFVMDFCLQEKETISGLEAVYLSTCSFYGERGKLDSGDFSYVSIRIEILGITSSFHSEEQRSQN